MGPTSTAAFSSAGGVPIESSSPSEGDVTEGSSSIAAAPVAPSTPASSPAAAAPVSGGTTYTATFTGYVSMDNI